MATPTQWNPDWTFEELSQAVIDTAPTIPDATADGQALAYGQAGAELAGVLSTGAVSIRDGGTFALRNDNGLDVRNTLNTGRTLLRTVASGGFEIYNQTNTRYILRVDPGLGLIDFSVTPGNQVIVPTPPEGATASAAKVVAFDSVTGRYAVQGPNGVLEQGDTDRRDVQSLLLNGWSTVAYGSYKPVLRRLGNVVFFTWYCNGSGKTDNVAFQPPAGFNVAPRTIVGGVLTTTTSNPAGQFSCTPSGPITVSLEGVNTIGFVTTTWETEDAWPTSLPGTPA